MRTAHTFISRFFHAFLLSASVSSDLKALYKCVIIIIIIIIIIIRRRDNDLMMTMIMTSMFEMRVQGRLNILLTPHSDRHISTKILLFITLSPQRPTSPAVNLTTDDADDVWRDGVVDRALDLQPRGRRFESRPLRFTYNHGQVVHTHVCLCSPSSINWYRRKHCTRHSSFSWCLAEGCWNGDQRRPMGPCGSWRTLGF